MLSGPSLLLALLVAPHVLAAPTSPSTGTLHVPVQRRGVHIRDMDPEDRLAAMIRSQAKTRAKYGIPMDTEAREMLAKRASGNVAMGGIDEAYFASLVIGTPPLQYEVVLDTGSSDLALGSAVSNLCGSTCKTTAHLYNPSQSSTSKNLNQAVSLSYGTADANGTLYSDVVNFGGFTQTVNMAVCDVANALTGAPDEDGLLGMAWQTISSSNSVPYVQGLWQTGQLTEPLFGFAMADLNAFNQPNSRAVVSGGTLTLGGTNASYYTGAITYTSLVDNGTYWNLALQDISVGGTSLGISFSAGATIDTGTNTIALPEAAADAIYSSIPGANIYDARSGLYYYPCNASIQFSLTFGGQAFTMNSRDFNFGTLSKNTGFCIGAVTSNGASQEASQTWIIGSPFLMSFYNVYRFDPPSVGFAPISDPNGVLESGAVPKSNGTASGSSSGSSSGSTTTSASTPVGSTAGTGSGSGSGTTSGVSGVWNMGTAGVLLGGVGFAFALLV